MEALNLLKFLRKPSKDDNVAVSEVISEIDYVNSDYHKGAGFSIPESDGYSCYDYDEDDDDDSFFELELNATKNGDEQLVESPRDVFHNERDFQIDSTISKPKFKVLLLGFKKSNTETTPASPRKTVEMPVLSRDNNLRSKLLKETFQDSSAKRPEKDLQKYLKLKVLKPLYTMASKRYTGDVVKFPDNSPVLSPATTPARKVSVESRISSFKNIGKCKSSVGMTPSPVNRRDDSLLHDGIQGAILHCNRSYNSPAKELSRCVSDPSHEKSVFRARD